MSNWVEIENLLKIKLGVWRVDELMLIVVLSLMVVGDMSDRG